MKIIVCLDKSKGMMFNGRRQSQDSVLRSKIMEYKGDAVLRMNEYSSRQFTEYPDVAVSESFLTEALEGEFCFIENSDIPNVSNIEEIYIFQWNRDYPADKYFELDPVTNGFKRVKKEDFAGSSHKKITLEIYKKV